MGAQSSRGPKVTKQDRAVLDLKIQRDRVRQYQLKLQHVLDCEYEAAREALRSGYKERARLALRRRAYQQGLIEKTDQQLATLQELVSTIEYAQLEQSIMYGLEQGNQVLRQIQKETSMDRVERLLDDTAEAQQYQREIDDMLSSHLTLEEQEAVEAELEQLASAATQKTVQEPSIALPTPPTSIPNKTVTQPSSSSYQREIITESS
ncbi:Similar to S.cerevisiae protein VPS20 (Myristoylated subunit of the ESCRT-III complex) [Malassezia sympodialis ATCC 42132]|uniref:Similar to S.cerevisiae protein VPS20 (Myristoylated subunit of the ESCRT-III complex) n=1 Tax=Malassezia sympodialis (strain ATCC 42132) TaxID=1230383 RepID=A0A1M8AA97_MALS4|nr:Similar to S.cerevisiae protein VPS20 (Myristoylated subunit of the ESCRT-III complex) [Malassezia sympodialis ATCC 42132]